MSVISSAIVRIINENDSDRKVVIRLCGTDYVLVEFGDIRLELTYRVRVYWFEKILRSMQVKGLQEMTAGVRSVLIKYDSLQLSLEKLSQVIELAEKNIGEYMGQEIQSRSVRLPIAFHDSKSREYIDKYMASVRSEAPYLPDNMEFIARCNGLSSIEEVQKYFLSSEQMVLGLGDVFLGAPCAVALDPSVRLSAPKYNPARTMTPEGAVGIGGAFMCIYPMESPGGYQLIGRTIPIWDAWQLNAAFKEAPWLLRNFDRIQFYEVTEEELDEMGKGVRDNRFSFEIEEGVFSLQEYEKFVETVRPQMELLRKNQEKFIIEATKGY